MRKRIAMIGDLHGNLPATRAMAEELEKLGPDEIWFLGDAVGKGPDSAATCDWVRANCQTVIGGNWDYGVGGKGFPHDAFYWDQLGEERLAWLSGLPREAELKMSGLRLRIFHGRPVLPILQGYDSNEKLREALCRPDGDRFDGVIFADSHRPFFRSLHEGYIANTGSVGNSMGVPRAHGLLLEGERDTDIPASLYCTVLSVPYDNEAAAEAARRVPDLPLGEAYIREVLTGYYSR